LTNPHGMHAVNALVGAAQKAGLHEVMVQGSQEAAVTQLLMGKGVPRKWIVSEGSKSKK
jgi:translation initiation factor 1 (eIF-1/SUI1)